MSTTDKTPAQRIEAAIVQLALAARRAGSPVDAASYRTAADDAHAALKELVARDARQQAALKAADVLESKLSDWARWANDSSRATHHAVIDALGAYRTARNA